MKKMIVKYGASTYCGETNDLIKYCDELMTILEKHLGNKYEIIVIPTGGYSSVEFYD